MSSRLPGTEIWTVAYRKRTANRFVRVSDWSGTWKQAYDLARIFTSLRPELQVYYVTTLAYEQHTAAEIAAGTLPAHYADDHGNVLTDSGKRVRMIDRPMPDDIRAELFPQSDKEAAEVAARIHLINARRPSPQYDHLDFEISKAALLLAITAAYPTLDAYLVYLAHRESSVHGVTIAQTAEAMLAEAEHDATLAVYDGVLTFVAVYPEVPADKVDGYTRNGTPFTIVRTSETGMLRGAALRMATRIKDELESWHIPYTVHTYGDWTPVEVPIGLPNLAPGAPIPGPTLADRPELLP